MKFWSMPVLAVCFLCVLTISLASATTVPPLPAAFFPSNNFTFNEVLEGTEVIHEFVVQNKGTAPLNIPKVQTS